MTETTKYDFICDSCKHTGDVHCHEDNLHDPRDCPECGTPGYYHRWSGKVTTAFISPEKLGRLKAPADFRNMLSQIKKAHPGCAIKDR